MRIHRRGIWTVPVAITVVLALWPLGAAANHMRDWVHDHSRKVLPPRPHGLGELRNRFGPACGRRANDARTWFPSAVARRVGGYVHYHSRLARNVGHNVRGHIFKVHRNGAIDYGVYGYSCRLKRGGTTYSTHAWGVSIDTNTFRNPFGQDHWNGRGADGENYRRYLPNVYRGDFPGHRFYWGLRWNDPHHFQYATGY